MKKQGTLNSFVVKRAGGGAAAAPAAPPALCAAPPAPAAAAAAASSDPVEAAFLADMDAAARAAHALARVRLGSSYDAHRTHGLLKWRAARGPR